MRRRAVLGALPVALAGCIDGLAAPRTADESVTAADATSAVDATTTRPSTSADAGASACDGTDVSLSRSTRVLRTGDGGEVETIAFALRNRSDRAAAVLADAWTIYRRACGSWTAAESGEGSGERRTLQPGGSHRWSLSVATHPTPRDPTTSYVVADLSTGLYSFEVTARVGGERVACSVRFEIQR